MDKIDIICHFYNLQKLNNLIKLNDIVKSILRKNRVKLFLKNLEENNKIEYVDNISYVSIDTFKDICSNYYSKYSTVKTSEIIYILNSNIEFDIIDYDKISGKKIYVIIKKNIKYYRIYDITTILNYSSSSKISSRVNINEIFKLKDLLDTTKCTFFGTDPNNSYITTNGITELLLKSRKNKEETKKLIHILKLNITIGGYKISTKETEYLSYIKKSLLPNIVFKEQYSVLNYIVDAYLPEYNIVLECDELGHKNYNKINDKKREELIIKELGCVFIRFNPDDRDFDILNIIEQINKIIYEKIKPFLKLKDITDQNMKINKKIIINKNNDDDNILLSDDENETKIITKSKVNIVKKKLKNDNVENNKMEINKTESNILENKKSKDDEIKYITEKLHKPKTTNCLDCNAEIEYRNKRCTGCEAKRRIKENSKADNRPSLEQLKKEVAESSYTAVGRKYGKSDNAIRKWIKNYEKLKS